MKFNVQITHFKKVDEIEGHWTNADFIELLDRFDFPDADQVKPEELRDMLFMAISDFKPNEAAAIMLDYKLSERLTKGQIDQLSHEMITDKVAEEYPDISFHEELFHINELLHKAYNGKFPHVRASIIDFELKQLKGDPEPVTEEIVIKAFNKGLSDRNLIKRLFEDQLEGKVEFPEAVDILWELHSLGNDTYKLITSDYWLNEEDFEMTEFVGEVVLFEEEED